MNSDYLIVDKRVLPDYYEKVVEARAMLQDGRSRDVSEAVKQVGISRSTYYKYKDYIFLPGGEAGRKAVLGFMLSHERGILSETLNLISDCGGNILTITQSLPINGRANVVISLDVTHLSIQIEELAAAIAKLKGASGVKLLAVE